MPWTVRQLAEAAGVSKQTISNRLEREGLTAWHVTVGPDGVRQVDDEAAQQILAKYPAKVAGGDARDAPGRPDHDEAVRVYEARIAELEDRLRDAEGERDRLRELNGELTRKVVGQADQIRSLPSPDAVDRAREDGEREGREAGEADGRARERERIADMGFWRRRRYLKEGR